MPIRSLLILAIVLCTQSALHAGKVKVWHQYQQNHYDKAKFDQAVVTSEGALRLSRQVKPFTALDAANIWDLIEDRAGNLYAATGGDEGKLFKITPDGKTSLLHSSKESQFFSLAVTPDGTVYAGTGPTGKIMRIAVDGKVTTAADNLDSYVWCLAYDPMSKSIYAGAPGRRGRSTFA